MYECELKNGTASLSRLLVRLVEKLPTGSPRIFGSLALLGLPFAAWGGALGLWFKLPGINRAIVLGWIWLASSPLLLFGAWRALRAYLRETAERLPAQDAVEYRRYCVELFFSIRHLEHLKVALSFCR